MRLPCWTTWKSSVEKQITSALDRRVRPWTWKQSNPICVCKLNRRTMFSILPKWTVRSSEQQAWIARTIECAIHLYEKYGFRKLCTFPAFFRINGQDIDFDLMNRDWLSGGENLPEILLGYHQYHDGDNEYSYCNLLRKMDKINHSDEPYSTVTSCVCGLYRNPMLCERLAGGTRILLKQKENRKIL